MNFIEIIPFVEKKGWNEVVRSFKEYDVYYLHGYVKAFQIHGDGDPLLLHYSSEELRGISVVMKRDIASFELFDGVLTQNQYFDIVTPYGYGGFLFEGNTSKTNLEKFDKSYFDLLNQENIVSEFIRFHPLLKNANEMRVISEVQDLGKTVSMDLKSSEIIWENMTSKNRNVIRKAKKNGVEIFHEKGLQIFEDFKKIYNVTMQHDNAAPYYYFGNDFYTSIHNDLNDNYEMFYAVHEDKIIAMSIILCANNTMHYHLSGSCFEYRNLAPTNLLLYKAACWGSLQGFQTFHLGGGLGSGEDSLYKFKEAFNRYSDNRFSIGKRIVNDKLYKSLVEKRVEMNSDFDLSSRYFPLYRSV
jgi:hypothetical protein